MQSWELTAREGIRDTVAAYADAGDRLRLEELAALFTEDGVLEVKGRRSAQGRGEIVAMLGGRAQSRANPQAETEKRSFFVRHFVTNLRFVTLEPDRAETTAYFLVLTPEGPDHWGRYRDVLVRRDDRWLFEHRLAAVDAGVSGSWFAQGER
jgi:ketosteroid isomerase-like protein